MKNTLSTIKAREDELNQLEMIINDPYAFDEPILRSYIWLRRQFLRIHKEEIENGTRKRT